MKSNKLRLKMARQKEIKDKIDEAICEWWHSYAPDLTTEEFDQLHLKLYHELCPAEMPK